MVDGQKREILSIQRSAIQSFFLYFVQGLTGAVGFLPAVEHFWIVVAAVARFCVDHGDFLTAVEHFRVVVAAVARFCVDHGGFLTAVEIKWISCQFSCRPSSMCSAETTSPTN